MAANGVRNKTEKGGAPPAHEVGNRRNGRLEIRFVLLAPVGAKKIIKRIFFIASRKWGEGLRPRHGNENMSFSTKWS